MTGIKLPGGQAPWPLHRRSAQQPPVDNPSFPTETEQESSETFIFLVSAF